jgi:ditrans,polycis-polyprenyl diphosphate synthase
MALPAKWLLNLPPIESFVEFSSNAIREAILGALRQGPVPQHIAFVMDGNRRYARGLKKEVIEGHSAGFETLGRVLEICYKIGVKVVTVYAFSIENFKRSKYEVDGLMEMAKLRLVQLAEHGELLHKYGARIQFVGRREILRPDVLEAIDHAMKLTENNRR